MSAGIAWQYEPVRLSGWTPDFRLVLNGVEAYAEVKPVSEFPMDVAQRVLNAGCTADILILGLEPRHAWRYRGDGWDTGVPGCVKTAVCCGGHRQP